ncbi:MAG: hypothetical protein FWD33_01370 [Alphaproteobacteria bacterium]|nr:hypothetical protein [Alphaproteobacteria bacterium]
MKLHLLMFTFAVGAVFASNAFACRTNDLIRCLDSACVTDITTDPGSRCRLCGPTDRARRAQLREDTYHGAGNALGFQALALDASSNVNLSARELRDAPTNSEDRFVWATEKCVAKIRNCDENNSWDTIEEYMKLVEQSCAASDAANRFHETATAVAEVKDTEMCVALTGLCMEEDARCGAGWVNCRGVGNDAAFDRFFGLCLLEHGCEDGEIREGNNVIKRRGSINADLKSQIRNLDVRDRERLANAETNAAADRQRRWNRAVNLCKDDRAKRDCIRVYCAMFDTALGARTVAATSLLAPETTDNCTHPAAREMATNLCTSFNAEACKVVNQANFNFGDNR